MDGRKADKQKPIKFPSHGSALSNLKNATYNVHEVKSIFNFANQYYSRH